MSETFENRLARNYATLSERLTQAAEFILGHQVDVATRSLRSISRESGLAPATYSRLARALEYDNYEELRDAMRVSVGYRVNLFSERARRLQSEHGTGRHDFQTRHIVACAENIQELAATLAPDQLEATVERLHEARRVCVAGALGSMGIAEYLVYMADYFTDNWQLAGGAGASLGSALAGLDRRDVLVVITKPPFASSIIRAAEVAREQGAFVVVITDSLSCPALTHASASFVVPTQSPHFFSSYAATLVLCETIIGMLTSRAGPSARRHIADVENRNRQLGAVWDG